MSGPTLRHEETATAEQADLLDKLAALIRGAMPGAGIVCHHATGPGFFGLLVTVPEGATPAEHMRNRSRIAYRAEGLGFRRIDPRRGAVDWQDWDLWALPTDPTAGIPGYDYKAPLYEISVSGPDIAARTWSLRTTKGAKDAREVGAGVLGITLTNDEATEGTTAQGHPVTVTAATKG